MTDGAVGGMMLRLRAVAYSEDEAFCIAQAAYVRPEKRHPKVPPTVLGRQEVTWEVSQTLKRLGPHPMGTEAHRQRILLWERIFGYGSWHEPVDPAEVYLPGTPKPPPAPATPGGHAPAQDLAFNPPPGWPKMPQGWLPPSGWSPDPSWPDPPPGWNHAVPRRLLMAPLDLSEDVNFGSPAAVAPERIDETVRRAADALAWNLCRIAAERRQQPLAVVAGMGEHLDKSVELARQRVFSRLLTDTHSWVNSLREGSVEREAALRHARQILDRNEAFVDAALSRMNDVLNASTQDRPRQRPAPAPTGTPPGSAAAPPPAPDSRTKEKRDVLWVLGIAAVLVAIVVGVASQSHSPVYAGESSQLASTLSSSGWIHDSASGLYWQWSQTTAHCTTTSGACSMVTVESAGPDCGQGVTVWLDRLSSTGDVLGTNIGTDTTYLPAGVAHTVEVQVSGHDTAKVRVNELVCRK